MDGGVHFCISPAHFWAFWSLKKLGCGPCFMLYTVSYRRHDFLAWRAHLGDHRFVFVQIIKVRTRAKFHAAYAAPSTAYVSSQHLRGNLFSRTCSPHKRQTPQRCCMTLTLWPYPSVPWTAWIQNLRDIEVKNDRLTKFKTRFFFKPFKGNINFSDFVPMYFLWEIFTSLCNNVCNV